MQEKIGKSRPRMVRKQILITPEQSRRLKARARSMGRPEAEVIRSAIDREVGLEPDDPDWKRRLLSVAGSFSREEADALENLVRRNRTRLNSRVDVIRRKLGGEE